MKTRILMPAALALVLMAGCNANKNKETVMENKEVKQETAVTPVNVNLNDYLGEEKAAGRVEVYDFDNFRLHVYYTQDVMDDVSYIVEGADSVITMEQPLFKVNVNEFNSYLDKVGKPVAGRIADYHVGGTGDHEVLMAQGMPEFVKGQVYGGMMQSFEKAFGDSMTDLPTGKENEVEFNTTRTIAGIPFVFRHGASSDFPGASIIIDGKVYYTHWTPAKAHMSHLQLTSRSAVDAEIAEAENELASGAVLFVGGHGGAANADAVKFKIEYLKTVRNLLESSESPQKFVEELTKAYPGLPGAEGLN